MHRAPQPDERGDEPDDDADGEHLDVGQAGCLHRERHDRGERQADERADRVLTRERLHEAVDVLPLTLAQPMMLQLEGLTQREIAETLGITENNVAVRLSRARAALRIALGGLSSSSSRDMP